MFSYYLCDGDWDCLDNFDEDLILCMIIVVFLCFVGLFSCGNGICFLRSKVCDGNEDCVNGVDEWWCKKDVCNWLEGNRCL